MKKIVTYLFLINSLIFAQSSKEENSKGIIGINSELSYKLLDQNQDLRKVKIFLIFHQGRYTTSF